MANGKMMRKMEKVIFKNIIGTIYYANGDKFEGNFKNDKKDGKGID